MKQLVLLVMLTLGAMIAYVIARDIAQATDSHKLSVEAKAESARHAPDARGKPRADPFLRAARRAESQSSASRPDTAAEDFPPLPLGPFGANIEALEQRAKAGDATAARALADGFKDCRGFQPPEDAAQIAEQAEKSTAMQLDFNEQMQDQVNSLVAKKGLPPISIPEPPIDKAYQQNLVKVRSRIERCTGVDPQAAENWFDWYTRAVELGDSEVSLGCWRMVLGDAFLRPLDDLPRERNLAVSAASRELGKGNPLALIAIGGMLDNGFFAAPDAFHAFVYLSAATHAPSSALVADSTRRNFFGVPSSAFRSELLRHDLQRIGTGLDPQQISQAERIGDELYARCCDGGGK